MLILGVVCFAVVTSILLVRTRGRAAAAGAAAREKVAGLKSQVDQLTGLLLSEPHVLVSWAGRRRRAGHHRRDPADDRRRRAAPRARVRRLARTPTTPAPWSARSSAARPWRRFPPHADDARPAAQVEAEGRAIGGRAVLQLRDGAASSASSASSRPAHEKLKGEAESLRAADRGAAVAGLGARRRRPARLRQCGLRARGRARKDGAKRWSAGARAVRRRGARASSTGRAAGGGLCGARLPAIVGGPRAAASTCSTFRPRRGSAGIGIDATEAETHAAASSPASTEAHRRTLDQLATGVAIFAADQQLTFYNAAYRALWDLDAGFLDQSADRFRGARPPARRRASCPRSRISAQWKAQLHEAYRRHRGEGARLAPARRPHPARRHHAQSATAA